MAPLVQPGRWPMVGGEVGRSGRWEWGLEASENGNSWWAILLCFAWLAQLPDRHAESALASLSSVVVAGPSATPLLRRRRLVLTWFSWQVARWVGRPVKGPVTQLHWREGGGCWVGWEVVSAAFHLSPTMIPLSHLEKTSWICHWLSVMRITASGLGVLTE